MQRVSHLESVNSISTSLSNLVRDFGGSQSELVDTVMEGYTLEEAHAGTRNQELTLCPDDSGSWMLGGESSEGTRNDFFLAVVEEYWVFNSRQHFALPSKCDFLFTLELGFLSSSHVEGDGHR